MHVRNRMSSQERNKCTCAIVSCVSNQERNKCISAIVSCELSGAQQMHVRNRMSSQERNKWMCVIVWAIRNATNARAQLCEQSGAQQMYVRNRASNQERNIQLTCMIFCNNFAWLNSDKTYLNFKYICPFTIVSLLVNIIKKYFHSNYTPHLPCFMPCNPHWPWCNRISDVISASTCRWQTVHCPESAGPTAVWPTPNPSLLIVGHQQLIDFFFFVAKLHAPRDP